jgi:hypothetical protein
MKAITIQDLKENSGLPGPRGNLELLHAFIRSCEPAIVKECLAELGDDTANSPEEFVSMCGVVGHALLWWKDEKELVRHLRKYSTHKSWRIRESVAIAIQEIPFADLGSRSDLTGRMETDDPFVHRAIVAGLCEPKNLRKQMGIEKVVEQLSRSTALLNHGKKLGAGEESLKKALGYCWSVAIVELPDVGKSEFEKLLGIGEKHTRWIVKENLKKNRLARMDGAWVEEMKRRLSSAIRRPSGVKLE